MSVEGGIKLDEDNSDEYYEEVKKLAKRIYDLEEEELSKIAKKYNCDVSDITELYAESQQQEWRG